MSHDLVDRRRGYACPDDDGDDDDEVNDHRNRIRDEVRASLGFPRGSGSPAASDHESAIALIDAAVERLAGRVQPTSTSHPRTRLKPLDRSGIARSPSEVPTASTRYGAQLHPERNLRAYLYFTVLDLPLAQIGRRLGISKPSAYKAKGSGAKLARAFAGSKLDPRRDHRVDRPHGKNERPW